MCGFQKVERRERVQPLTYAPYAQYFANDFRCHHFLQAGPERHLQLDPGEEGAP